MGTGTVTGDGMEIGCAKAGMFGDGFKTWGWMGLGWKVIPCSSLFVSCVT